MKMNCKHIVLFVLMIGFHFSCFAQSRKSDSISRHVNLEALKLIERYENGYIFRSNRDYDNFERLFEDETTPIFNDILPDNNLDQQIGIKDYLNLIDEYYDKSEMNVEVIPYEIGKINFSSEYSSGSVDVYADKIISGETKSGFNYIDTFEIIIQVSFDRNKYKIANIEATKNYGKYCLIQVNSKNVFGSTKILENHILLVNTKRVQVNENGLYFIKRIDDYTEIKIQSSDKQLIGKHTITKEFFEQ